MTYNKYYNLAHKVSNKISMMFKGKQSEVENLISAIENKYIEKGKTIDVLDIGCDEGRLTKIIKNKLGDK